MHQLVNAPTQRCGHTLDWVVVREGASRVTFRGVLECPGLSDHQAVACKLSNVCPSPPTCSVMSRNLHQVEPTEFKRELQAAVSGPKEQTDVDSLAAAYDTGLRQVLDRHAPLVTRRVRDRPSAP